VPLRRKKLRPDLGKVCGFPAFRSAPTAMFRNFAGQIPHIRQGLSSEQFCMPGLVRPVTYFLRCGNVNGRDKPGHGDAQKKEERNEN
jgi:hypothetical protein